jgi:hypothetical protein
VLAAHSVAQTNHQLPVHSAELQKKLHVLWLLHGPHKAEGEEGGFLLRGLCEVTCRRLVRNATQKNFLHSPDSCLSRMQRSRESGTACTVLCVGGGDACLLQGPPGWPTGDSWLGQ